MLHTLWLFGQLEQYRFLRKISYGLDVLVAGILALETSDVIAAYLTSSPFTINNQYAVAAGITALALRACTASMESDLKYAWQFSIEHRKPFKQILSVPTKGISHGGIVQPGRTHRWSRWRRRFKSGYPHYIHQFKGAQVLAAFPFLFLFCSDLV